MSAAKAAGAKLAVVIERAATARAFFKVIVIDLPLNDLAHRDNQTIEIKYDDLMTI
jgi:hypothetical protein